EPLIGKEVASPIRITFESTTTIEPGQERSERQPTCDASRSRSESNWTPNQVRSNQQGESIRSNLMIIHATAADGRPIPWGESSPEAMKESQRKRGAGRKAATQIARSRFALEDDRLVEAIASEIPG